ncbi:unnamed protein product, partial [Gulo gulo]
AASPPGFSPRWHPGPLVSPTRCPAPRIQAGPELSPAEGPRPRPPRASPGNSHPKLPATVRRLRPGDVAFFSVLPEGFHP